MECRLCLRSSPAETTVSIHDNPASLPQRIWSCCQLQVQKGDGLPNSICSSCEFNLLFFAKFRDVCIRSDKILRSRLAEGLNVKTEEIILDDLNWEREFVENSLSHPHYSIAIDEENGVNSKKGIVKNEIDIDFTPKEELSHNNDDYPSFNEDEDFFFEDPCFESKMSTEQINISSKQNTSLSDSINTKFKKLLNDTSKSKLHLSEDIDESKVRFTCVYCSSYFFHKSSLERHLERYHPTNNIKCEICLKSFKSQDYLEAHKKIHSGKTNHKCNICSKYFVTRGNFNRHLKLHSNRKPYECDICPKSFSREDILKKHQKTHNTKKNVLKCTKNVKSKLQGERRYKCNICSISFSSKNTLNGHKEVHELSKPYECDICSASFNRKGNLMKHMIIHTGDKPYKCNVCSKKFARKSNLKFHSKLHTGNKPYACQICSKKFARNAYLTSHMHFVHKEKFQQCNICNMSFSTKENLIRHRQNQHMKISKQLS